jgi:hypothetical protein
MRGNAGTRRDTLDDMADDDPGDEMPSLAPPRLGFGRRRRRGVAGKNVADPQPAAADAGTEPARAAQDAPTTVFEADDQVTAEQPTRFDAERVTSPAGPMPPPQAPPPLFADEVEQPSVDDDAVGAEDETDKEADERPPSMLGGFLAVLVTGAVVGLAAASFRLCEAASGTSSCGGPGFFLLLAIVASTVVLGAGMLRVFRVVDPGSTSFLAVGLLCVLALLFLVDVIFAWWMIIAIPVVSMITFALSHWVTATLIEPADR